MKTINQWSVTPSSLACDRYYSELICIFICLTWKYISLSRHLGAARTQRQHSCRDSLQEGLQWFLLQGRWRWGGGLEGAAWVLNWGLGVLLSGMHTCLWWLGLEICLFPRKMCGYIVDGYIYVLWDIYMDYEIYIWIMDLTYFCNDLWSDQDLDFNLSTRMVKQSFHHDSWISKQMIPSTNKHCIYSEFSQ